MGGVCKHYFSLLTVLMVQFYYIWWSSFRIESSYFSESEEGWAEDIELWY